MFLDTEIFEDQDNDDDGGLWQDWATSVDRDLRSRVISASCVSDRNHEQVSTDLVEVALDVHVAQIRDQMNMEEEQDHQLVGELAEELSGCLLSNERHLAIVVNVGKYFGNTVNNVLDHPNLTEGVLYAAARTYLSYEHQRRILWNSNCSPRIVDVILQNVSSALQDLNVHDPETHELEDLIMDLRFFAKEGQQKSTHLKAHELFSHIVLEAFGCYECDT